MDYKDLTLEDIERMQEEINHFYRLRKLFLGIGWSLIGLGIIFMILAIVNATNAAGGFLVWLTSFLIAGGIAMFIVRGALFNRRIKSRKLLIKQATEYQKMRSSFDENK